MNNKNNILNNKIFEMSLNVDEAMFKLKTDEKEENKTKIGRNIIYTIIDTV